MLCIVCRFLFARVGLVVAVVTGIPAVSALVHAARLCEPLGTNVYLKEWHA